MTAIHERRMTKPTQRCPVSPIGDIEVTYGRERAKLNLDDRGFRAYEKHIRSKIRHIILHLLVFRWPKMIRVQSKVSAVLR